MWPPDSDLTLETSRLSLQFEETDHWPNNLHNKHRISQADAAELRLGLYKMWFAHFTPVFVLCSSSLGQTPVCTWCRLPSGGLCHPWRSDIKPVKTLNACTDVVMVSVFVAVVYGAGWDTLTWAHRWYWVMEDRNGCSWHNWVMCFGGFIGGWKNLGDVFNKPGTVGVELFF